jgi:hypothetical protein
MKSTMDRRSSRVFAAALSSLMLLGCSDGKSEDRPDAGAAHQTIDSGLRTAIDAGTIARVDAGTKMLSDQGGTSKLPCSDGGVALCRARYGNRPTNVCLRGYCEELAYDHCKPGGEGCPASGACANVSAACDGCSSATACTARSVCELISGPSWDCRTAAETGADLDDGGVARPDAGNQPDAGPDTGG